LLLPLLLPATTEAPISSSMPIRKPDLMINIPGSSAAAEPQLPYSQRPQANMEFRGQQVHSTLQHMSLMLPELPTPRLYVFMSGSNVGLLDC
jgi:hypothetical protein